MREADAPRKIRPPTCCRAATSVSVLRLCRGFVRGISLLEDHGVAVRCAHRNLRRLPV